MITIFTIGHSTHPIDKLVEMLHANAVEHLVDVRSIPQSRRNPQFNRETLAVSLLQTGIAYTHAPGLGGLRKPRPDSMNTAWQNDAFRGYADHMQTNEFATALDQLIKGASGHRTVIMCAEAVPWRCHRSLISDALAARGVAVEHIFTSAKHEPHRYTPFARIDNGGVTYPGLA